MNQQNEWLGIEIKLSRTAVSATQGQISEATGLSVQSIKRLERKGSNPRYKTIENLREVFRMLGVTLERQNTGITIHLSNELLSAINSSTLSEFTAANILKIAAARQEQQENKSSVIKSDKVEVL